jgi:hypothetical protein
MFWIDLLIACVLGLIVASLVLALLLLEPPLRDTLGRSPGEARGTKIRFFALLLLLLGIVILGYVA